MILLLLLLGVLLTFALRGKVKITLHGAKEIQLEYGTPYEEPGAEAWFQVGLSQKRQEVPVTITGQDAVDHTKLGTYEIKYQAEWENKRHTVVRKVRVVDTTAPVIQLVNDPNHYTPPGQAYQEEGFTAIDNYDGDLTDRVKRTSDGKTVTYTVTDSSGNTTVVTRTILYGDQKAPEIILKGTASMTIIVGTAFEEPGYTATDNADGDLTANVEVRGTVDTATIGTYVLTYTVTDAAGHTTVVERSVTVVKEIDTIRPVITLKGSTTIKLNVGDVFAEPGYTASDNTDGNLTSRVQVSGDVNTAQAGTYFIRYTVADAAGNQRSVYRTVIVRQSSTSSTPKTIYLTFDDGPGAYTEQLLDILAKYGAKATFFVVDTGYSTEYKARVMKRIVEEGHTIAIHTATHQFHKIYANEDAYFKDLYKMQELIRKATGVTTMLMRFPGGSSNTISRNYNRGIMSRLTLEVEKRGFTYFDWNVDSNDAGGANTAAQVYANVTKGCTWNQTPVVLMHDIKKATVNAMEDILKWGAERGYTFAGLDENSPTAHHPVYN